MPRRAHPGIILLVVLLCLAPGVQAQDGVATDKAALTALYNATDGANWTPNTNWTTDEPLSSWHGVTTNSDGRVTRLELDGNGLDGTLPAELGNLSALEQLDLQNNALSGALPDELANLTNITSLLLNESRALTGPLPDGLRELSGLETVNIEKTELCAPGGDAFQTWLDTITFSGLICPPAEQSVIDVAVFYTSAARENAGGTDVIATSIDLMVAETNAAYEASGANQRIKLVAVEEVVGYTEANDSDIDLIRLQSPSDGHMDEVHDIRDAVAADIVLLIPTGLTGWAFQMFVPSTSSESRAFGVVNAESTHTFAHELGHIMGLHHDRYAVCGDNCNHFTRFPYAFGYVNQRVLEPSPPDTAFWRTIMAYRNQCGGCSAILRFSNPDQIYPDPGGDPLGKAGLEPAPGADGPSDAVRMLNRTRGYVANFRPTITDDDPAPVVTLKLTPNAIGENAGVSTVTASLNRASSAVTTVTVSAMALDPAVSGDFMLSGNRILTIPAGQIDSTGTVTVRAVNNTVDAPNKTVTVSATADNSQGVDGNPSPVTLRITDDDDAPEVTLKLTPDAIGENGGVTTVTASLNRASSAVTTVTVSAMAVDPAVSNDFMLSTNRILTIPVGQTDSTGTVTVRAVNNTVDAPNKTVTVSATADNSQGVDGNPSPVTLRITDDDDAPEVTLAGRPATIVEAGGSAMVTVEITNGVTFAEDQEIALSFAGTATQGTDYTVALESLTLTAGQSSVATTLTAVQDRVDDDVETILITASHGGVTIGAEQTITIIDDDPTTCSGGMAGTYPCSNVDLMSVLALADIGGGEANDIWGWTDSSTGKEYAIMGRTNGTSFVDISDPANPIYLGNLPPHSGNSTWRDIKVYADHAFVVTEATNSGMQVFDLTELRSVAAPPATFSETAHYSGFSDAHNLAINEDSGFAYAVGTNNCGRGLHMINIQTPTNPTSAGCFSDDGYTHDAQCVNYDGPDLDHQGKEICFNSNVDTLTIVDVTNKAAPALLSRTGYSGSRHAHQGWLTEDQVYFLLDDELDERDNPDVTNTRTYMWNVSDLDDPALIGSHDSTTTAIDHNQYVKGKYTYQSNYQAGLRILDITDIANGNLSEAAFFDFNPGSDPTNYEGGTWSNYPFFDSGIVIVSVIEQGLFILRPNLVDVVNPALASAAVNGAALTLTYGEALDESSMPATDAFTVTVAGGGRTVTHVSVSGRVVTLTLASVVAHDETVTVSYSPGTNPIRDAVGNAAFGLSNRPVTNETPDNPATGVPTITGTAQVGETLTAVTTGIMDADGLTSPTYTYQWIRVISSVDADIAGATSSTYTLVAANEGATIKVRVTFEDDASNPETRTSAPTVVVVLKLSVVLKLMPDSIGENGGVSTVTASLNRASSAVTTVTVTAEAVSAAVSDDFMLSANRTLTIAAGRTDSIGTVTVRAVDNNVDATNKEVRVSATADNSQGVAGNPSPVTLRITDDDDAPELTLAVRPSSIAESGGSATVTVEITNGIAFAENQRIPLAFAGTASKGTDYTVALERLTLAAEESSVTTTVTAVDDAIDDDAETIRVTARHGGGVLGAGQTITITDDDASPVIVTASPILVEENETAVATLAATDADRPAEDLMWRITGGADRNRFRLTPDGALAFRAAPDYEAPGDSDRNGDYEVTVEVSDGANPVEAVFTIRLEDVDDTAPALSSASVNGATLTLTYGEALDPNSRPAASDFTVSGGNSARTVSNVGVSGQAVTLTLDPAVEHGETGIRVSYRPGTDPIQDAAGNDAVGLSNQPVTNNTGDTAAPTVTRVEITSRPERAATYAAGEAIEVTVTFSETVVVTGTPRLRLNVGGVNRTTAYRSGTGAAAVFVYRVADGESDTDGVSIEANSPALNGGRIRDGADNNALLTHDGVAADPGHKVDGVKPTLAANGGAVVNGATLALTYGEALDGGSTPLPAAFTVNVEGAERRVARVAVSGSAVTLTLDPAVGVGQTVRLSYRVPGATPIQDTVGNAAEALTNRAVENNTRDTMAPTVSRVAITSNPGPDGIYAKEDVIEVTVTFSETVVVDTTDGTPELALTVGRQSKPALYIPGPASVGQTFTYTVEERDIDTDGVSLAAGRIALNAGTIQDLADNPSLLVYEAVPPQPGHAVDGVRPELQGASVSGATLTLTYGEALDGDSTPAVGDFTVTVMDTERPLNEVLVSGSTVTLTLDAPVTPGETVTVSYTTGTDPIQDTAGNAAEELTEYTVGAPPPVTSTGGGGGGGGGGSPARPAVNTDPVITTPGPFEVEENQTRVVRIEALDSDPGDAIRSYAIAGGADGGRFSIVAHTGVLSFREPPNFEAPTDALSTDPPSEAGDNEYIVVVRVASGPISRGRTVEQAFAVRVTDENRESPGVPDAPRLTLALDASLTVEWSAPENTGPPITDYDVQYREGTSGFFINAPHEGTGRAATLRGLGAATRYQVQVRARNEEGTGRWSEPGEGLTLAGPAAVLPFSVPDRGGVSLTSQGTLPELRVGYGQVETDAGMTPAAGLAIFGSRLNGILASEAGVPASVPVLEGRIFAETDGPVRTGLALANPHDSVATGAFFFTDSDGIDFGHGTFTLGPREQIARFLDEGPFNGGSAIEGTFTFTADLPVAVIALRGFVNERSEFLMTTLPVASLAVPTTATVYFPHFAAGGGWTTQVILVNPTHAPISGTVQFFGPGSETEAAAPATLTLDDGRSGSTFSYAISPRSATRLRTTNPAGPLRVGSVRAVPDTGQPAPSGVSIFSFQKDGTTVSEAGVPASSAGTAFRVYVEAHGTPGQPHSVRSGIALTNTSGATTTVMLELTDLDGAATGPTASLRIPASGHVAQFIDEFFPTLTTPFSGILRIASTGPDIAAVGLRLAINQRDDILVTTTPPVDETAAPTASDLFFPHFVDSGGWTTQFILFSGSPGQSASGVIRFTGQDGQPLELPVAPTTAPTIP